MRQPAPGEEVPHRRRAGTHTPLRRQLLGNLLQRDIRLRLNQLKDEGFVRIELRARRLPLGRRRYRTALPPLPMPLDRR
jgi:hypothetical protein